MQKDTETRQTAPAAPPRPPAAPPAAFGAPARTQTPPGPEGPQNALERPEGEAPRLVPLDIEGEQIGGWAVGIVETEALAGRGIPAGAVLRFRVGEPIEQGDIALARLSTGGLIVGTIEPGPRFAWASVWAQSLSFAVPEPAALHVAPCLLWGTRTPAGERLRRQAEAEAKAQAEAGSE